MKTYKKLNDQQFIEIIMPFTGKESEAGADGYFDECPHCREMKEMEKEGLIEVFESELE